MAIPRHLAIIMDGNGRWATAQGLNRSAGHRHGADRVPPLVQRCSELGMEGLTLYSFSTENWSREQAEVDFLMALYVEYIKAQRPQLMDNNIRFKQIGRRDGLPQEVLDELDRSTEMTAAHTGLTLNLAINYGSRAEITDAVRAIATQVAAGTLLPEAIETRAHRRRAVHRRSARSGPADSHGGGNAAEQLSAVAAELRGAVRGRRVLAGL